MLLQLSNMAFFHLLCVPHYTPDEPIRNHQKSRDLFDQVNRNAYVWSYSEDGTACLRFIILVIF